MQVCSGKLSRCRDCKFSVFVAVDKHLDVLGDIAAAIEAVGDGPRFNPPPTEVAAHVVVSPVAGPTDPLVGLLIRTPLTTGLPVQLNEVGVARLSSDQVRLDISPELLVNAECFKFNVMVGHCYNMCFN